MKNKVLFIFTGILMFILGASDTLRGIFTPLFTEGFGVTVTELGLIVSASYLGNIIFLLAGGMILDKLGIRKSLVTFMSLLMASEAILLFSHSFPSLATGFFLTLGLSTLLNTTVNLYSDRFSEKKALMYVNILFFIQGIGTTLSQFVFSRNAGSRDAWSFALLFFIAVLIPTCIILSRAKGLENREKVRIEKKETSGKLQYFPLLLLTFTLAFYLIGEHGVTNYLILYGEKSLHRDPGSMGTALAMFSAGIMMGRLLFSPFIDRVGDKLMMLFSTLLSGIAALLVFRFGILPATLLMGLSCSTVYPTLVAMVRKHVPSGAASRATTVVISIASSADILFNMNFGHLTKSFGYESTMMMLAIAMFLASAFILILGIRDKKRD